MIGNYKKFKIESVRRNGSEEFEVYGWRSFFWGWEALDKAPSFMRAKYLMEQRALEGRRTRPTMYYDAHGVHKT